MEISAANLTALFTGFDVIFQRGFEKPPSYYDKIASVTRSSTRQTVYPWLGRTTQFREWLGDRTLQALEAHEYTIVNKAWEDTVEIDRNDIEDDQFGVYEPIIEQLGWDTKVHPDVLLFTMIKNAVANIDTTGANAVIGYDGKTFFSAEHPVGPMGAGRRQKATANVVTTGAGPYWFLLDAGRAIRPFIFQLRREYAVTRMNTPTDEAVFNRHTFRYGVDGRANVGVGLWQLAFASNTDLSNPANYGAAIAAMRSVKTDAGLPFGSWSSPETAKFLLVPPALEEVARQLLNSEFMAGAGASATVPTTNIWRNSAQLVVSEYLA
jgi:phage major head subunit gpT-like protein